MNTLAFPLLLVSGARRILRGAAFLLTCLLGSTRMDAAVFNYAVTNTNSSGPGSLDAAITAAIQARSLVNGSSLNENEWRVVFNIPNPSGNTLTIQPTGFLPKISQSITIDGTTQPGYAGTPLIEISGSAASSNASGLTIGEDEDLDLRGVAINSFQRYGIYGEPGSGLQMTGCAIGTNPAGTTALPNEEGGLLVSTVNNFGYRPPGSVKIGGTGAGEENVISGNGGAGVVVYGYANIQNNRIGTSRNGLAPLPNQGAGVIVVETGTEAAGGVGEGWSYVAGNVISGNTGIGLYLVSFSIYHSVKNNIIGLGADGSTDLGNGGAGLRLNVFGADVGGPSVADGNLISGNDGYGIEIYGVKYPYLPDSPSLFRNNLIGTNAAGTAARANGAGGIYMFSDPFGEYTRGVVVVGASGAGNVISGNGANGVNVEGGEMLLMGNFIGISRSFAPLGNTGNGVRANEGRIIAGSAENPALGNIIGSNAGHGIFCLGGATLKAEGNYVGVSPVGAFLGNDGDGIHHLPIVSPSWVETTVIGGTIPNSANTIANNSGAGVALPEPLGAVGEFIGVLGNSIYGNGGLGIDLAATGVLPNDPRDADNGANGRQNYPVITAATPTQVIGTLASTPDTRFRIEVFRTQADVAGHGEGRYFLGAAEVKSDGAGLAAFGLRGLSLAAGQSVTATASVIEEYYDPFTPPAVEVIHNTSEFAANLNVSSEEVASFAFSSAASNISEGSSGIAVSVQRSGITSTAASVQYATRALTAVAGADFTATSGTLSFAAGQTSLFFWVPLVNNGVHEGEETFEILLSAPVGGLVSGPALHTVTILDDEPQPELNITPSFSVVEGHTGTTTVFIDITLSAPSELPVSAYYQFWNGTANFQDYTEHTSPIYFAPGQTKLTHSVEIFGDTDVEPDEIINIDLALRPTNAVLGSQTQCVLTILNDDDSSPGTLQLEASGVTVAESNGTITLAVQRTGGTGGAASVQYSITGGTATVNEDYAYAGSTGVLNFAHGQSSANITLTLFDDYLPESTETLVLQLSNATGATLGSNTTYTLSVTDSDEYYSISGKVAGPDGSGIPGVSVYLGGSGNTTLITDASGTYTFGNLIGGRNYIVSPFLSGYTFTPSSLSFNNLAATRTDQNFTGVVGVVSMPELSIALLSGGQVFLTWPSDSTGWTLQSSSTLGVGSWQNVTVTPTVRNGYFQVILPAASQGFFRLTNENGGGDDEM